MVSGFDRYFQIAKCFRDEDSRADRQPEFTQIDLEMSFVDERDVMKTIEELIAALWSKFQGSTLQLPFERMSYDEAMAQYGSDKPDRRFEYKIKEYKRTHDEIIELLQLPKWKLSQEEINLIMTEFASLSQKARFDYSAFDGSKPFSKSESFEYSESLDPDCLTLVSKRPLKICLGATPLGRIRLMWANALEAKQRRIRNSAWDFFWVNQFPLFSQREDGSLCSMHHPFTAPSNEEELQNDALQATAKHYDLVLNGTEIGGGSIRIHKSALQHRIFTEFLKLSQEELKQFSHLLEALKMGCPPHGGIALGLDRLVAIMCGKASIRDVIAFPKASSGVDLCFDAPSVVAGDHLLQYGLKRK